MNERPILFNEYMVRAILEGRKTETRQPLTKQPIDIMPMNMPNKWIAMMSQNPNRGLLVECRYGVPGDKLWVRETHAIETNRGLGQHVPPFNDGRPLRWVGDPDDEQYWEQCHYRASDPEPELAYGDSGSEPCVRWRPSIHMPRWASRITLTIKSVRVERLQDITEEDAQAEGVVSLMRGDLRYGFMNMWDSIYAKKFPWASNPWVWVIGFEARLREGEK
jgi:hypothetical protein